MKFMDNKIQCFYSMSISAIKNDVYM